MSRDIISQLKKLRTEPRAGYVSEEVRERGRESLMQAIGSSQQTEVKWVSGATFEFIRFTISDLMAKPAMAFASFAILALGGFTTVSAASHSLPGDTLYGVKIVTERAQLHLTSAEKKAVLHTEFAERRLHELAGLTANESADERLVTNTVNAFKREMESATREIQNLESGKPGSLIAQVSEMNIRMRDLSDTVSRDSIKSGADVKEDIQNTTTRTSETVVNTVVGAHEKAPEPSSTRELENLFRARLNKLNERRTYNIGRMSVIESNAKFTDVSSPRELSELRANIETAMERMDEASNIAAAGGYRSAFDILRESEADISIVEKALSKIESKFIVEILDIVIEPEIPVDETDPDDEKTDTDSGDNDTQTETP